MNECVRAQAGNIHLVSAILWYYFLQVRVSSDAMHASSSSRIKIYKEPSVVPRSEMRRIGDDNT